MAEDVQAPSDEAVDLTDSAQLAALQAENEALRARIDEQKPGDPVWRKVLAGVLAVLAVLAVVAAVDALWLKTTLENEDQFVSTFQPLPQSDAVAEALSVRIANGVVEAQGVEAFVTDTLPPALGLLAVPITDSIEEVIARVAKEVVQSDAVTGVWTATLRGTHIAVSAILSGENGQVAINLDEIAAVVVEQVEASGLDLPDVELELGSVVIYESDELATAQTVAQGISTAGWVLPVVALLLIAVAIWVAPNRRRMVAFLGFGTAIVLLIGLAAERVAQNATLDGIDDEVTREAAVAVWDATLSRLTSATWALIVLALIVGFVAWLVGSSTRAGQLRKSSSRAIESWTKAPQEEPSGFTLFLYEWKRPIQVVVAGLGLLFVLFGPTPSGWLVIITTGVVLGVVVLVEVLAGAGETTSEGKRESAEV